MPEMPPSRVGLLIGSNSRESLNRKLAGAVVKTAPAGLEFVEIRIDELPMFNRDLLHPTPPTEVRRFTEQCREVDGFFFVMPEHNRSVPALLKNALDWGSMPKGASVWLDKPCAMTGTSPGAVGTGIGQQHLRQILAICGATVMGGEAYLSFHPELIAADGGFGVESTRLLMQSFLDRFARLVAAVRKQQ